VTTATNKQQIDALIERTEKKLDVLQNQLSAEVQIQLRRASLGISTLDSCSEAVDKLREKSALLFFLFFFFFNIVNNGSDRDHDS